MVRKKLAVMVAALGAFQADVVSALGMGDVSLNSALNQPLDAEIRLLNTNDLDSTQVRISLADQAAFKRSGVEREFFLSNIEFTVQLDGSGNGVIKLTTQEPVVEPFLNFLVETRWPSGRLLREYTVLLDLPVFSEAGTAPIEQASSARPQADPVPSGATTAASATAIASARRADESVGSADSYRVKNDDTLWKIARDSRVRRDQSVQQTMVSLQRINPQAFVAGNINRLKSGAVLRLPTETEIDSVVDRQAVQEVANQNKAWKSGGESKTVTGSQLDATERSGPEGDQHREEARLTIAAGGGSEQSSVVDGEGDAGSGSEALRNELQSTEETLSKAERENDELHSRLDGMEEKVATLQRLLELKDDQLAVMQRDIAREEDLALTPAGEGPTSDSDSVMSEQDVTTGAVNSDEPMAAVEDNVAAGVETQPVAALEKKPSVPQSTSLPVKPGVIEQLLENPLYAGGAGLLVLAIAAVLLMRRRKEDEEEGALVPAEELEDFTVDDSLSELSLDTVEVDGPVPEPENDSTDLLVAELEQSIAAEQALEETLQENQQEAQSTVLQAETGDVIAEADIYIAYGRFVQAIELLKTAITQEPERSDLQVKLLQVFIESRDKQGFQQHYTVLQSLGDESAEIEVKEMLSSVDGVSDWLQDLPVASATEQEPVEDSTEALVQPDEELALDVDLDIDDGFSSTTILDPDAAAKEFDFDLDLDDLADATPQEGAGLTGDNLLDLEEEFSAAENSEPSLAGFASADNGLVDELEGLGEELGLEADDDGEFNLDELASSEFEDLDFADFETEGKSEAQGSAETDDLVLSLDELDSGDLDSELSLDDLDGGDLGSELSLDDLDGGGLDSALSLDDLEGGDLGSELSLDDLDGGGLDSALSLDDLEGGDLGSELSLDELEGGEIEQDSPLEELSADDLDLSGLDLATTAAASATQLPDAEDGLDLDLDGDFDFDDLEGGDLDGLSAELSAEFDDGEQLIGGSKGEEGLGAAALVAETVAADSDVEAEKDDFDFLADGDEVATKLDLARAYIDMGDTEGAKDILTEVIEEGSEQQQQEAQALRERFD